MDLLDLGDVIRTTTLSFPYSVRSAFSAHVEFWSLNPWAIEANQIT